MERWGSTFWSQEPCPGPCRAHSEHRSGAGPTEGDRDQQHTLEDPVSRKGQRRGCTSSPGPVRRRNPVPAQRTCPWEGAPTGLSWPPGPWPLSPGSMLEPGLVSCPLLPDLPSLFPAILLFLLLLSEGRDKHSPVSMLTEEVTLSIFFGNLLAFAALFWPWASPNPGCSLPHRQTPKTIQGPVTKTPEPLFC